MSMGKEEKRKKKKGEPEIQNTKLGTQKPAKTAEELAQEHLDGWRRALADYENLKREVERSRQEYARLANRGLVVSLLPVLDNFYVATEHVPDISTCAPEAEARLQAWITGVEYVRKQLITAFEQEGLREIETTGVFDPSRHEATAEEESLQREGTILKVVLPGYYWQSAVLRPARVIVSKGPPPEKETP